MNYAERLAAEVAKRRKWVVVIGDAIVDCWVYGRVEPCQDGCPKFVQDWGCDTPGGAANAQRCLEHWGVDTVLFCQADRPVKTRFLDDGIVWRWDDDVHERKENHLLARRNALESVRWAGAVLLSDYDKGFLTQELVSEVTSLCRARGIPCVADCKRAPDFYSGATLKCNGVWGFDHRMAQWLSCHKEASYVETHGAEYPAVWEDEFWVPDAGFGGPKLRPVPCVNHVGAGDCFAAHLALALAYRLPLREAAAVAHSAGRVYVQHPHNRAPYPQEVIDDGRLS